MMFYLSVSENGKISINPKKRKSDRTGEENDDVE